MGGQSLTTQPFIIHDQITRIQTSVMSAYRFALAACITAAAVACCSVQADQEQRFMGTTMQTMTAEYQVTADKGLKY